MKPVIVSAAAIALVALAGPALASPGPEVEIEQGTSSLPALRVSRDGDNVRIDGGLRRRGLFSGGGFIRNCRSGPAGGEPGAGASVEVRNVGRINLSDAPLIVIRTPRAVDVDASGAVFGSVGRGASSVELGNGGCGTWHVANTEGPVSLSVAGSGDIRTGTSASLDIAIGGSGSVRAGATRELDISIGGSGDVVVARADGPTDIAIGGSGDVDIRAGAVPDLSISIAGSGDVNFGGVAGDVSVSIAGSGDVVVARATGAVSRSVVGAGDIRIGN